MTDAVSVFSQVCDMIPNGLHINKVDYAVVLAPSISTLGFRVGRSTGRATTLVIVVTRGRAVLHAAVGIS